jgi:ATP-dependent HslUV protease, peptidase subunit HslV
MSFEGTTVIAVKKGNSVAMASDGQVTFGNTVLKATARKIRRVYDDKILVGFAGATADAFTLFERFEGKIKEFKGDITRASVELAKEWRTDRMLSKLEAMLLVADKSKILLISGTGDVVEPDKGVSAIGSGGPYAYAAAIAYLENGELTARDIADRSLKIAAEICIYTNDQITVEELL